MKLKKHKTKEYACDNCNSNERHIDMYNEEFCYNCIDINTGELRADKTTLKDKNFDGLHGKQILLVCGVCKKQHYPRCR